MNTKEQTAVEFLLEHFEPFMKKPPSMPQDKFIEWKKRTSHFAKQMEKKQMISAHFDGVEMTVKAYQKYINTPITSEILDNIKKGTDTHEDGEEYYKQRYEKEIIDGSRVVD